MECLSAFTGIRTGSGGEIGDCGISAHGCHLGLPPPVLNRLDEI